MDANQRVVNALNLTHGANATTLDMNDTKATLLGKLALSSRHKHKEIIYYSKPSVG